MTMSLPMNDQQRTDKLRKFAKIYLAGSAVPFVIALISSKENTASALFTLWPLLTIWYFLAYRDIAKGYRCESTRFLALHFTVGGSLQGIMYAWSKLLLLFMGLMLAFAMFGG